MDQSTSFLETEGDESTDLIFGSPSEENKIAQVASGKRYRKVEDTDLDQEQTGFQTVFGSKKQVQFIPQTEVHSERMRDFAKDTEF